MSTPAGEIQVKTPAWAETQASGAGLGVSPAHLAAAQQHVYEAPYRRCIKAGGITYPIAVCPVCRKVIEPSRKEFSKTGAHGTWYYAHPHPLIFVILEQSNSGKREVVVPEGFPANLETGIRTLWVYHKVEPEDVEETLRALLGGEEG
jgi:hypothetical protein